MEKIDRKKYPLGGVLEEERLQEAILDKLDELIEENKIMAGRILALEKRVANHTHLITGLPSFF